MNHELETNLLSKNSEALPASQVVVDFGTDPKTAELAMAAHLEETGQNSTLQTPSGAEFVLDLNLNR